MSTDIVKMFFIFVALVLAQVLVLNHIHLFGCATPLLYVYFLLRLDSEFPRWASLLCGFLLGLCLDAFSNTPGLATASLTLVALLQPYVLNLFIQHDTQDTVYPSFHTLGFGKYLSYTFICVATYTVVFFTLETFSFFNWLQWIYNIVGSTIITILLVMVLESVRRK